MPRYIAGLQLELKTEKPWTPTWPRFFHTRLGRRSISVTHKSNVNISANGVCA